MWGTENIANITKLDEPHDWNQSERWCHISTSDSDAAFLSQHMPHVITNMSLWFEWFNQCLLTQIQGPEAEEEKQQSVRHIAEQQYKLLMGVTAHISWDTSTGCVTKFSSDSLWLYNQHRAPLMMDSHSQSTLCAVDSAMCLMFPVQKSFANQTDFIPLNYSGCYHGSFFSIFNKSAPVWDTASLHWTPEWWI